MSVRENAKKAISACRLLAEDIQIPKTLREVNVTREMFPQIIQGTMEYRLLWQNPVSMTESIVEQILENAF